MRFGYKNSSKGKVLLELLKMKEKISDVSITSAGSQLIRPVIELIASTFSVKEGTVSEMLDFFSFSEISETRRL